MKLSIITPYYREYDYIKELCRVLKPQLERYSKYVEWIIVDDGCMERGLDNFPAKVIHLKENTGGASIPRNVGLKESKGEYVVFIDSDDVVHRTYIRKILEKINSSTFDYCYFSWQYIGKKNDIVRIKEEPPTFNTSVWNCVYKRDLIGDYEFDPRLRIGEDREFNKLVRRGKRENIPDVLYYYRDGVENSLMQSKIIYNEKYKKE